MGEMSSSAGARSVLGNMTNLRGPDTGLLRPGIKTHVTGGYSTTGELFGEQIFVLDIICLGYKLQKCFNINRIRNIILTSECFYNFM